MGIPSIGIVAVLVANVTFIGWVTPPGMKHPKSLTQCKTPSAIAFTAAASTAAAHYVCMSVGNLLASH